MRAFPNSWVFPGGKLEVNPPSGYTGEEREFKLQALQELWEELGIIPEFDPPHLDRAKSITEFVPPDLLDRLFSSMRFVGRRQTPPFSKRVFDAAYFLLEVKNINDPKPDGTEAVEARWVRPERIIEEFQEGKVIIPPPVLRLLRLFTGSIDKAIQESLKDQNRPVGLQTPVEFAEGVEHVPLKSYTAKPFEFTNLTIFRGDKATVLVDPGWNSDADNARPLLETIKTDTVRVILTHHHKDHVSGLSLIEEMFPEAVVMATEFTLQMVETRLTRLPIDDLILELERNGEAWPLRLLPAPGHTAGHLVVYDMKNDLVVAGDHVVGIGTALLDPRNGSISDYLRTTEMLIDLNPRLILPAHGPVIFESRKRLEYYKKHRLEREQQVIESLRKGNSTVEEIVADIYRDVSKELWRYAGFNVLLHLKKLMEEGKLKALEKITDENYERVRFELNS